VKRKRHNKETLTLLSQVIHNARATVTDNPQHRITNTVIKLFNVLAETRTVVIQGGPKSK